MTEIAAPPLKTAHVPHFTDPEAARAAASKSNAVQAATKALIEEAGEPRPKDGCYVLLAVQSSFQRIPATLNEFGPNAPTKKIHPQQWKDSLDQATVDKIVRVESTRTKQWTGFDFAVLARPKAHVGKRKAKRQKPTVSQAGPLG